MDQETRRNISYTSRLPVEIHGLSSSTPRAEYLHLRSFRQAQQQLALLKYYARQPGIHEQYSLDSEAVTLVSIPDPLYKGGGLVTFL